MQSLTKEELNLICPACHQPIVGEKGPLNKHILSFETDFSFMKALLWLNGFTCQQAQ